MAYQDQGGNDHMYSATFVLLIRTIFQIGRLTSTLGGVQPEWIYTDMPILFIAPEIIQPLHLQLAEIYRISRLCICFWVDGRWTRTYRL